MPNETGRRFDVARIGWENETNNLYLDFPQNDIPRQYPQNLANARGIMGAQMPQAVKSELGRAKIADEIAVANKELTEIRKALEAKDRLIDFLYKELDKYPNVELEEETRQDLIDRAVDLITPFESDRKTRCKEIAIARYKDGDESGKIGDSWLDYQMAMSFGFKPEYQDTIKKVVHKYPDSRK